MAGKRARGRISGARRGPMFVLAGLPPATNKRAIAELLGRFPEGQVIGNASTARDGELYPIQLCRSLARAVTEFASRRRAGTNRPVAPKSIILLYVPAPDSERLLSIFEFAVMPEPLSTLQARDDAGRQLRHAYDAVRTALGGAVAPDGRARAAVNLVNERLARLADSEPMLLPPRNFLTTQGRLAAKFREYGLGARDWRDRLTELGPVELRHDDVARIPKDRSRRAFVDARNLAFLAAHPAAFHALPREIAYEYVSADTEAAHEVRMRVLRSLYRFGGVLESGFHHDAQRSDGLGLVNFEFECSAEGRVVVTGPYANIYPNDYVRAPGKRLI